MANLADLLVHIGADTADLDSSVGKSQSKLSKFGSVVAKGAKVAAAGIAAVGGAAVTGAFKIADYGDEIAKTAPKLGISTDALQELNFWAERNGISTETLERGVGRLNQRIGRAIDGNAKYAEAFEAVGVSLTDQQGNIRDTEVVLEDTISALRGVEDPAQRSAMASEIFGTKMARDLMPALMDGSLSLEDAAAKAHELGAVMGGDALAASERFQDEWLGLKTQAAGFLRSGLIPVMSFMADKLFPFIAEQLVPKLQTFGDWIGPKIAAATELVLPALRAVGDVIQNVIIPAISSFVGWVERNSTVLTVIASVIAAVFIPHYVALGAAAAVSSAQQVAAWVATKAGAIGAAAVHSAQVARMVAGWVLLGAQSLAQAARVAAAWLIAMGPIAIVIAAVIGLVALIIANWDKISAATTKAWSAISGFVSRHSDTIKRIVTTLARVVLGVLTGGLSELVIAVVRNWDRIVAAVRNAGSRLLGFVRSLPGLILSALGNLGSILWSAGQNIIQGLIDGIMSKVRAVTSAIGSVASTIRGALPFSPAKWGPLRKHPPDEAGRVIGADLASGIADQQRVVAAAAAKLAGSTRDPLQEAASNLLAHVRGGGRMFEDFSARGVDELGMNDRLAGRFFKQNPNFDFGAPGTRGRVEQFLAEQARKGGATKLEIRSGGSQMDDLLVELIRRAVRTQGGSVQEVLGT